MLRWTRRTRLYNKSIFGVFAWRIRSSRWYSLQNIFKLSVDSDHMFPKKRQDEMEADLHPRSVHMHLPVHCLQTTHMVCMPQAKQDVWTRIFMNTWMWSASGKPLCRAQHYDVLPWNLGNAWLADRVSSPRLCVWPDVYAMGASSCQRWCTGSRGRTRGEHSELLEYGDWVAWPAWRHADGRSCGIAHRHFPAKRWCSMS